MFKKMTKAWVPAFLGIFLIFALCACFSDFGLNDYEEGTLTINLGAGGARSLTDGSNPPASGVFSGTTFRVYLVDAAGKLFGPYSLDATGTISVPVGSYRTILVGAMYNGEMYAAGAGVLHSENDLITIMIAEGLEYESGGSGDSSNYPIEVYPEDYFPEGFPESGWLPPDVYPEEDWPPYYGSDDENWGDDEEFDILDFFIPTRTTPLEITSGKSAQLSVNMQYIVEFTIVEELNNLKRGDDYDLYEIFKPVFYSSRSEGKPITWEVLGSEEYLDGEYVKTIYINSAGRLVIDKNRFNQYFTILAYIDGIEYPAYSWVDLGYIGSIIPPPDDMGWITIEFDNPPHADLTEALWFDVVIDGVEYSDGLYGYDRSLYLPVGTYDSIFINAWHRNNATNENINFANGSYIANTTTSNQPITVVENQTETVYVTLNYNRYIDITAPTEKILKGKSYDPNDLFKPVLYSSEYPYNEYTYIDWNLNYETYTSPMGETQFVDGHFTIPPNAMAKTLTARAQLSYELGEQSRSNEVTVDVEVIPDTEEFTPLYISTGGFNNISSSGNYVLTVTEDTYVDIAPTFPDNSVIIIQSSREDDIKKLILRDTVANQNILDVSPNVTVYLNNVILQGHRETGHYASLVRISGTFVMTGRGTEIKDNGSEHTGYGGGVMVNSGGTFYMIDGKIHNNEANAGGGVSVWSTGSFYMIGGEISGNTAHTVSAYGGGGVYILDGPFIKTGGYIYGNDGEDTDNNSVNNVGHALYYEIDMVPGMYWYYNATHGPSDGTISTSSLTTGWTPSN